MLCGSVPVQNFDRNSKWDQNQKAKYPMSEIPTAANLSLVAEDCISEHATEKHFVDDVVRFFVAL
jgi:hypothetical protein